MLDEILLLLILLAILPLTWREIATRRSVQRLTAWLRFWR